MTEFGCLFLQVFGAFVSCSLKTCEQFYGGGESFLFSFYPRFRVLYFALFCSAHSGGRPEWAELFKLQVSFNC